MPHLVYLFVDVGIFLDVGIGLGDVGLRLVVIVVTDKILHRIIGKQPFHLPVELCRKGFVGSNDQGRPLDLGNHLGNGKSLSGSGDPEKNLLIQPLIQPIYEIRNGIRLISAWTETGSDFKHQASRRFPLVRLPE